MLIKGNSTAGTGTLCNGTVPSLSLFIGIPLKFMQKFQKKSTKSTGSGDDYWARTFFHTWGHGAVLFGEKLYDERLHVEEEDVTVRVLLVSSETVHHQRVGPHLFLYQHHHDYLPVLAISDIMVRIRIPGSVSLTNRIRIKLRIRLLFSLILRMRKKNYFFHIFFS